MLLKEATTKDGGKFKTTEKKDEFQKKQVTPDQWQEPPPPLMN